MFRLFKPLIWTVVFLNAFLQVDANVMIAQPTVLNAYQTLTIQKSALTQYFAYELKEGEGVTLQIKVLNSQVEHSLDVFSPDDLTQRMLIQRYLSTGKTVVVEFTAKVSGNYIFAVNGSGAAEFELTLFPAFFNVPLPAAVYMPALSFTSSAYLVDGVIEREQGLSQYFRFEAQQGDNITLQIDALEVSGELAFVLYDSQEQVITIEKNIYSNSARQFSFIAQRHSVYYLKISGGSGQYKLTTSGIRFDGDADNDGISNTAELYRGSAVFRADSNLNGQSDYQMALQGLPGRLQVEWSRQQIASANSIEFAMELPYREDFFSLRKAAGAKYIKFSARGNEYLTVLLQSRLNFGKASLKVLNNLGHTVYELRSIADKTFNVADIKTLSPGDYYVELSGDAGVFELAVVSGFTEPGESESSLSLGFYSAANLAAGAYHQELAAQYFRFNASAGDEISIRLLALLNRGSLSMRLYYQDSLTDDIAYVSDINHQKHKTLMLTAQQTGVYFLKVSGSTGSFVLEIDGIDADGDADSDGLSDSAEWLRGTDPSQHDTSGSGINDKEAVLLGLQGRNKVELFAKQLTEGASIDSAILLPAFNDEISLHQNGNSVFFRIPAKQGDYYALTFRTQTHNKFMGFRLYEPGNRTQPMLAIHNLYDAALYSYDLQTATDGDYILEVYGGPGILDFALWHGFATPNKPESIIAFSSSRNTARVLKSGLYQRTLRDDYFRFEAQAGEWVTIDITAHLNRSELRAEVYPAQSNASWLVQSDIYNEETRRLHYKAVTSGVHFVKVSGTGGRYKLQVSPDQTDIDSDNDGLSNMAEWQRGSDPLNADTNNDGFSDLQNLMQGLTGLYRSEFGRAEVSSAVSIAQATDVPYQNRLFAYQHDGTSRFFAVPVKSGQRYTVLLTGLINQGSLSLALYKPNATKAYTSTGRVFSANAGELSFIAEQDGDYILEVLGNAGVAALAVYEGYLTDGNYDQKRDFFYSNYTARRLLDGDYQRNKYGLADFYRINVQHGQTLVITLTAHTLSGQLIARLVDENGVQLIPAVGARDGQEVHLTYLPQTDATIVLEVGGVKGFYTLSSSGSLVPAFTTNAFLDNKNTANSRGYIKQATFETMEGQRSRFTLMPYDGFKVSSRVIGSCPEGNWLDEFTYETGIIFTACQISFAFEQLNPQRKRLPLWMFLPVR